MADGVEASTKYTGGHLGKHDFLTAGSSTMWLLKSPTSGYLYTPKAKHDKMPDTSYTNLGVVGTLGPYKACIPAWPATDEGVPKDPEATESVDKQSCTTPATLDPPLIPVVSERTIKMNTKGTTSVGGSVICSHLSLKVTLK